MITFYPWIVWCVAIIVTVVTVQITMHIGLWWVTRRHAVSDEFTARHQFAIFKITLLAGFTGIAIATIISMVIDEMGAHNLI